MARDIGQYQQSHANDGRVAGTHAVHAVIEISAIGNGRHHKNGKDNKQHPACCYLIVSQETHHLGVVEIVILHKRDGGLQRLYRLRLMLYNDFLILLLYGNILTDDSIGTEPQRKTNNEADGHLAHNLVLALQAILIAAEHLDIIVEEAQEA